MYESYYKLTEEPFRLSPNSRFRYKHATYKKAYAYMEYALHRSEGFVMITGQPGTGKTTLINDLTSNLSNGKALFANLASTQLEGDDLLRMVATNFGLAQTCDYKSTLLHQLETFFRKSQASGRRPLLIIDEAQGLSRTALEELRLLTNLQQHNQPLLQIFLVGQDELRDIVMSPELEQLHQRIVAACHMEPLTAQDTRRYIEHRLIQVGWRNDPQISDEIYPLIHRFSLGIPRWINLICSRLLLHGMVEEKHHLDREDINDVLRGLVEEQLLPARFYAGEGGLLDDIGLPQQEPLAVGRTPDTQASAVADDPRTPRVPVEDTSESPEGDLAPGAESAPSEPATHLHAVQAAPSSTPSDESTEEDTGSSSGSFVAREPTSQSDRSPFTPVKSEAVLLFTQLQPQLANQPFDSQLDIFLDFLDGRTIEGTTLNLEESARRELSKMGLLTWFRSRHGDLHGQDLREDIVEIMALVSWLKEQQPGLSNEQLETVGLLFKFMQSDKAA